MKKFFNRVLIRIYWFYNKVIKESDSFMLFFYTSFAFTMFIVFYVWGLILFIERKLNIQYDFGVKKFLLSLGVIMTFFIIYFFRRRQKFEEMLSKDFDCRFNNYDIGVIAYIVMSFIVCIYNVVQSRV